MEFNSVRLFFREFEEYDYDLFSSVFSDERVMRYAYMDRITDDESMRGYFKEVMGNRNSGDKRNSYEFAVFTRDGNAFIGFADIMLNFHYTRVKYAEIGYFLLPRFWGLGYATEIARMLTDLCFTRLGVHKVVATCNANNNQSENVMKKVGMAKEGIHRKERYKNGQWDDELKYGILIDEWEALKNGEAH